MKHPLIPYNSQYFGEFKYVKGEFGFQWPKCVRTRDGTLTNANWLLDGHANELDRPIIAAKAIEEWTERANRWGILAEFWKETNALRYVDCLQEAGCCMATAEEWRLWGRADELGPRGVRIIGDVLRNTVITIDVSRWVTPAATQPASEPSGTH